MCKGCVLPCDVTVLSGVDRKFMVDNRASILKVNFSPGGP